VVVPWRYPGGNIHGVFIPNHQVPVEVTVTYFIYDTCSLPACSMTRYSWYIAAVPHLHRSLATNGYDSCLNYRKRVWPRPLQKSHELGLLPFVKQFRIRMGISTYDSHMEFNPKRLCGRALCYFSALTNLQELGIYYLQVSSCIPTVQRCFGHLSSMLRFLSLKKPSGHNLGYREAVPTTTADWAFRQ